MKEGTGIVQSYLTGTKIQSSFGFIYKPTKFLLFFFSIPTSSAGFLVPNIIPHLHLLVLLSLGNCGSQPRFISCLLWLKPQAPCIRTAKPQEISPNSPSSHSQNRLPLSCSSFLSSLSPSLHSLPFFSYDLLCIRHCVIHWVYSNN